MGLGRFFRRAHWDAERARELDSYIAEAIDDNLARGMTLEQARSAAHRKLGNTTLIREEIYTMNSLGWLETVGQDLRYGARLLRRNPTFAIVAVLTLALGTGANTAIFQLVDAIRLRSLPVDRPEELAEVRIVQAPNGRTGSFMGRYAMLTYPLYVHIRDAQQVFTDIAAWGTTTLDLAQGGEERPAQAILVSGNFFPVLGVRPAAGRLLQPSDDVKGCGPVAVLGHAFWRREYGADPSIAGRTILLGGHRFEVAGVVSLEFTGVDVGRDFDVAVPLCTEPMIRGARSGLDRSDVWFLASIARLKPGLTVEQASAQLASLSKGMLTATVSPRYTAEDAKSYVEMVIGARPAMSGLSELRRTYSNSLNLLLGVTAAVLLIACANLANLLLARATAREREVAIRLAIGASRGRIVRQMLSESLLIAAMGAGAGLLVARWFSASLVAFLSSSNNPLFVDLSLDWRVFAFTAAVAVAACVLFGLAPALRATRTSPGAFLKAGRGTTDGRERFGIRRGLVVLQVALSLVLVVGALLLTRSLLNLTTMDPGFRQDGVMTIQLDMRKANLSDEARPGAVRAIVERVRAIPGVRAAAQAFTTPVGGNFWNQNVVVDGKVQKQLSNFNAVGSGYFDAIGIQFVAGRDFDTRDTPQSPNVAIVTESFVRAFLAGRNPIGQSFQMENAIGEPRPFYEIVGVVRDTKYTDLREPFAPLAHLASTQSPPGPFLLVVARIDVAPAAFTAAATRAIGEVNPSITLQYRSVKTQLAQSLLQERLMATLSSFFAGLAVLIATIGLYGVMSYMVARRRIEIGVRMALGADATTVIRMIVREAGVLLIVGLAIGTVLAVFAARSAAALLYNLTPGDPATVAMAIAALASVTLLAGWIPARRASRLAPTDALRED